MDIQHENILVSQIASECVILGSSINELKTKADEVRPGVRPVMLKRLDELARRRDTTQMLADSIAEERAPDPLLVRRLAEELSSLRVDIQKMFRDY